MRKVLDSLTAYQRRRYGGGGLSAKATYQRRKVFHIIPTGKEKKFSTFDKLFEKFFTMLKTVLKKIVSRETLSDLVPKFCLQFGERFSAERVEHFVIERAEK